MVHVLGIFGSPRRGGNTDRLLESFLAGAGESGGPCSRVLVAEESLAPCSGCRRCETDGRCVIEDGMQRVYGLIEEADLIALAAPIYFYGLPAQAKALIDRSQMFWARKHRLGLRARKRRAGYLIAAGGSKGKRLFDCVELTTRYFCDAIDADYLGALTFRSLDRPEDLDRHPEYLDQARREGRRIAAGLADAGGTPRAGRPTEEEKGL